MKNTSCCPTVASPLVTRRLFALGAAVILLTTPALVLTGCGSGGGGGGGGGGSTPSISGKIVDLNAGSAGVAGATIQFAGASTQTNANGNFSLTVPQNTPSGSATITPPAGKVFYTFAATSTGCANALIFVVPATSTSNLSIGTIAVYGNEGPPNIPCGL